MMKFLVRWLLVRWFIVCVSLMLLLIFMLFLVRVGMIVLLIYLIGFCVNLLVLMMLFLLLCSFSWFCLFSDFFVVILVMKVLNIVWSCVLVLELFVFEIRKGSMFWRNFWLKIFLEVCEYLIVFVNVCGFIFLLVIC